MLFLEAYLKVTILSSIEQVKLLLAKHVTLSSRHWDVSTELRMFSMSATLLATLSLIQSLQPKSVPGQRETVNTDESNKSSNCGLLLIRSPQLTAVTTIQYAEQGVRF